MATTTTAIESPTLPLDAMVEILARLPIKSLIRFQSVCKSWRQLFSTPDFIHLYHSRRHSPEDDHALVIHCYDKDDNDDGALLLLTRSGAISRCSFQFLAHGDFVLMASCSGLLCFMCRPRQELMYVCNPITRQFRRLPDSPKPIGPVLIHCYLSFDPLTFNFKVIRLATRLTDRTVLACQVFDSMADSWNALPVLELAGAGLMHPFSLGVVSNGFLYLQTYVSVIALDLSNGMCDAFPLPEDPSKDFRGFILLELNGSPSMLFKRGDGWMNVWVLSHSTSRWSLVERVNISSLNLIDLCPVTQDKDVIFMREEPTNLYMYRRESQVWERIDSYAEISSSTDGLFSEDGFKSTLFPCHN